MRSFPREPGIHTAPPGQTHTVFAEKEKKKACFIVCLLSLDQKKKANKMKKMEMKSDFSWAVVAYAFNTSTQEAEVGRCL